MNATGQTWACAALLAGGALLGTTRVGAVDLPEVGGQTPSLDISNSAELGYHFDNRNDKALGGTLNPADHLDDDYGEALQRLQLRAFYERFELGVRLDTALYFHTLTRPGARALIDAELATADLGLENQFNEELHSRFGQHLGAGTRGLIYPAKLWVGFKHRSVEATVGDFYAQLGRGLVFSVRKIDEVGVDTTVRGAKVRLKHKLGSGLRLEGTAFGGLLNPMRLDFPTARVLNGTGSPLFFGFPEAADFRYYRANPAYDPADPGGAGPRYLEDITLAKPSYLEDAVVGGSFLLAPRWAEVGLNAAVLLRQDDTAEQLACLDDVAAGRPPDPPDLPAGSPAPSSTDVCRARFPSFQHSEPSRLHAQIHNYSLSLRVPPIAKLVDGYLEGAAQWQADGRVAKVDEAGNPTMREQDLLGYALYANVNLSRGPFGVSFEGKHYRSFFALGANTDNGGPPFGAPEFTVVSYSRPPNAESIYTEPIGAPEVCTTGGRTRFDYRANPLLKVYGWVGRSRSFSEIDQSNDECATSPELRTDTWDTAAGAEIDAPGRRSHYWGWVGARMTDRAVPTRENPELAEPTEVFYREGYVRYDFNQRLGGDLSLSALGYHRRRFEPGALSRTWHEGENLLALNYHPHFAFVFGYEYQTRPGLPTHYFNGAIQYRSRSGERWYHQLADSVRLFVGQRRAALRCVGGTCRVYPAFEGARLELVSRF